MSFPGASVFLLPPRPALRDWPLAGACAGLLLGLAELALAAPGGPPPPLALLTTGSLALALAGAGFALGLLLQLLHVRPTHSTLIAWVTGLIPLAAAASLALPSPRPSRLVALSGLALAVLVVAGVTLLAARIADRSERAGTPANALLVWGATALLVAAGERAGTGEAPFGIAPAVLLAGLVLVIAAAACGLYLLARRRGSSRPRASFGSLLGVLVAAAGAAAAAPWALPWLLAEPDLPRTGDAPANILIVAVGPAAGGESGAAARHTGVLAAFTGLRFEPIVPERTRAFEALLTLPDGAPLVPVLVGAGYVTAAILADASLVPDVGAREVDARPGGRAQLERELRWLAAAPWLAGPGRRALERLGLGGEARSPEALGSDARSWLLRHAASPSPFFLLVDFRSREAAVSSEAEREEEAVATLLDHVDEVGLALRTLVVLARTGGPLEPPLRVLVRPPLAWPGGAREAVAARPVHASELGATLRQIARRDAATPIAFPGIVGAWPASSPRLATVGGPASEARSEPQASEVH